MTMTQTNPIDPTAAAIIAGQILARGAPPIDLQRFRPFRPMGVRSCVYGGIADLGILFGARHYHPEYLGLTEVLVKMHAPAQTEAAEVVQ